MGKYISIGTFNKYYFLILGSISVKLLNTFIIGFFPSLNPGNPINLFGIKTNLLSHPLIKNAIQYLGIGLGGLILEFYFFIYNKNIEKETNLNDINQSTHTSYNPSFSSPLIYNDIFSKNKKVYLKKIFFVFFLYYFSKMSISSFDSLGFHQAKYWTFEFIALYYFTLKILGTKIYKHQILSLSIILIFSTLLYFINSFIQESNEKCIKGDDIVVFENCILLKLNVYEKIIHKLYWYFIPIIIIIYFSAMSCNAYVSVINKWFMDIKYIKISKIISYIGIIGFIFSLISLVILTFISCPREKKFMATVCQLNYNGLLFYDNFMSLQDISIDSNFYFELFILIPLYMISNFLGVYFELLVIKNLDPFYLIPIDTCYYIIYETLDFLFTLSRANLFSNIRFILGVSSDLISIICCSIYLEIIELHFYNLDENIKKNIIFRSSIDTISTELKKEDKEDENNEDINDN